MIELDDSDVTATTDLVVTFTDRVEHWGPSPHFLAVLAAGSLAADPPEGFVSAHLVDVADQARDDELDGEDRGVAQDYVKGEHGYFKGARPKHDGAAGVRIVHHGPDPDPYGEKMDLEAATRQDSRAPADQEAIDTYQSTRWLEINDPLRAGQQPPDSYEGGHGQARPDTPGGELHSPARDVARLDALATSEGGVPYETDLWRGVSSDHVFPAGNLTGTTFRDLGFVSTTANRDTAEAFSFPGGGEPGKILARIRVPKGTPAILAEGEVILARGTTFHILSDRPASGNVRRLLELEVAP